MQQVLDLARHRHGHAVAPRVEVADVKNAYRASGFERSLDQFDATGVRQFAEAGDYMVGISI
jgi:hypothetical protein